MPLGLAEFFCSEVSAQYMGVAIVSLVCSDGLIDLG
jgi:hypothetical protein